VDSRGRAVVDGDAALCPWRFAGQYRDDETGLHYNRFRYYDADAGQYISRDPLGLRAGLRVYGYVGDPGVASDPLGLSPVAGEGCGGGPFRGGKHGQTKAPSGDGLESHHMPADSTSPLPTDQGPAIQMAPEDHRRTASHGRSASSAGYRARQKQLIDEGRFDDAFMMDVEDVQSLFGDKYDEAILEAIDALP